MINENQEVAVIPEGTEEGTQGDTISVKKSDYEVLNQTLGSLKRELKDLKKAPKETSQKTEDATPENNTLLEKAFLRTAGITDKEEVELALTTAKKWGVSIDSLVDDEDFQGKLEKHRTAKANALATSNIKGDKSGGGAKDTTAYWIAKGTTPKPDQVPDRKTRVKIIREIMATGKQGKTFYSD
jgi:hypothetical protein